MSIVSRVVAVCAFVVFASPVFAIDGENALTSPYANDGVKAIIRIADKTGVSEKYDFPATPPKFVKRNDIFVASLLCLNGEATEKLTTASRGSVIDVIDDTISDARLAKALSHVQEKWIKVTGDAECPVTMDDLKCFNQDAATMVCVAVSFPKSWKKGEVTLLDGETVEGVTINDVVGVEEDGKVAFQVPLSDDGKVFLRVREDGFVGEIGDDVFSVTMPSVKIAKKNDYQEKYPEFFTSAGASLEFFDGGDSFISSWKENVSLTINEEGVFGISVVSMAAMSKGIVFPQNADIVIDEPFVAEVVVQDAKKEFILFRLDANDLTNLSED